MRKTEEENLNTGESPSGKNSPEETESPQAREEDAPEAESEETPAEAGEETEDPVESLEKKLEAKEAELNELREKVVRIQAEAENYKKRMSREKEEFAQYANEKLLKELIPLIDNLERAFNAPEADVDTYKEGLAMILKQFEDFLKKQQVEPIPALGEKFDPSVHDALTQMETEDHQENMVLQEYSKGYYLNDRVLRPSQVVISKAPAGNNRSSGEESQESGKDSEEKS